MAIWFIEGFDHYTKDTYGAGGAGSVNTGVDVLKKWTGYFNNVTPTYVDISPFYARQLPGQGMSMVNGSNSGLYKTYPGAAQATMFGGTAFMYTGWNQNIGILVFYENNQEQCSVRADTGGHIIMTRAGTVLATSTNTLSLNTWYYVEAKVTIHNSTGQYEVRINGTSVNWIPQSAANQNTRAGTNNSATGMGIYNPSNSTQVRWDDMYFGDTTGGVNDTFIGPQMVTTLRPAAAGNYAQWTPNFGANFGNVNEIYPDGDVTFNQSATANQIDSFVFSKMPIASGTIAAIQHVLYAKQDGGGVRSVAPLQRSGGSDYAGTAVNLTTSYQMVREVINVNPVDSAAFAIADIDGAEFGYKLIS